jgi:hypothetical protein
MERRRLQFNPDEIRLVHAKPGLPTGDARIDNYTSRQKGRNVKLVCRTDGCRCGGYIVRTSRKWIDVGTPKCPFGGDLEED